MMMTMMMMHCAVPQPEAKSKALVWAARENWSILIMSVVAVVFFSLKVAVRDAASGHVAVYHQSRRVYFTIVSVVLFFAPLFLMAVTYSLATSSVLIQVDSVVKVHKQRPQQPSDVIVTSSSWRHSGRDVTYSLVVWKVWSRQRPGELTSSGVRLENKLRKQVSLVRQIAIHDITVSKNVGQESPLPIAKSAEYLLDLYFYMVGLIRQPCIACITILNQ